MGGAILIKVAVIASVILILIVTIQPSRGLLIKIGQSAVEENLESIRRRDSVFSASGEVTAEAAENLRAFHGAKTA
jgi:hypothetical protein